jgi:hypothetical protein
MEEKLFIHHEYRNGGQQQLNKTKPSPHCAHANLQMDTIAKNIVFSTKEDQCMTRFLRKP